MTLEETIEYYKGKVVESVTNGRLTCADEYYQLMTWLMDLKKLREEMKNNK